MAIRLCPICGGESDDRKGGCVHCGFDLTPENALAIHPVAKVKKFHKKRKESPYIEAVWPMEFADIGIYYPGGATEGLRYRWSSEESEFADQSKPITLCTIADTQRCTIHPSRIECVPAGEVLYIWADDFPDKLDSSFFAVIGEVEKLPFDDLSRHGKSRMSLSSSRPSDAPVPSCPRCGSTSIMAAKKGFGVGKAVIGAYLLGPVGLAVGSIGSNKIERICANCGHRF